MITVVMVSFGLAWFLFIASNIWRNQRDQFAPFVISLLMFSNVLIIADSLRHEMFVLFFVTIVLVLAEGYIGMKFAVEIDKEDLDWGTMSDAWFHTTMNILFFLQTIVMMIWTNLT